MRTAARTLAAACLVTWAGAAAAQAEKKPAPQAPRDEAPRINLKLDAPSLRQITPYVSPGVPATNPVDPVLPSLGGAAERKVRSFDGRSGQPYPKDMNPDQ